MPHLEAVLRLALFGSYVHGDATDESDIDVLVDYERNFLIHEYFGVSEKVLWDTYKKNLPDLKETLLKIK